MRGTVLYGPRDIRFEDCAEPAIINPTDAIIRLAAPAFAGPTCGPTAAFKQSPGRPRWDTNTAVSSKWSVAP
jgi:hypothetical protein